MNSIKTFKDNLFKSANEKGFTDWEIFYQSADSFGIRVLKGEVVEYKNAGNSGAAFRGTIDNKIGCSYSDKINDDAIPFLLDNAAVNAQLIENDDMEELYTGDKEYAEVSLFSSELDMITADELINKALEIERIAAGIDPRVISVDACSINTLKSFKYIANSYGLDLFQKANYANAYVIARVAQNGKTTADSAIWFGNNFYELNPEILAKNAVQGALSFIGAKSIPSGVYDIILDEREASILLAAFKDMFNANRVYKGFSLLNGKIGQSIANHNITIKDDALIPFRRGSRAFDDEGAATRNKTIVKNGILKTFLHNSKTAGIFGVNSTGNGHKSSYKSSLDIAPTNLYIVPSDTAKDELVMEMKNGLIIKDLEGINSGTNPVSGDFSLMCRGYLVENGVIVHPVEHITISSNFFTLLKKIKKIGNYIDLSISNIASPSLWIKEISVSSGT